MDSFVLLVTWLVAKQPPSSYQTVFASEQDCKMARVGILVEAQRIKSEFEKRAEQGAAAAGINAAEYLMVNPPPSVAATCAKK